jgi:Uncharacterised protein family (UPF0167)
MPQGVLAEVSRRVPSYSSWQQDLWRYHCSGGCAFLGPVRREELGHRSPEATTALVVEAHGWPEDQVQAFVDALDRDGQPTGYLSLLPALRGLPGLLRRHVAGAPGSGPAWTSPAGAHRSTDLVRGWQGQVDYALMIRRGRDQLAEDGAGR